MTRRRRRVAIVLTLFASMLCSIHALGAWAQTRFTDDARRSVTLPAHPTRVFAAGAPAEVLLYTLVPDMLVGRNHMPTAAALEFTPPPLRFPKPIKNLPDRDDPRYDDELLALKPDVYVDYGTVDDDYVAALEAITGRTKVPALILDGRLTNIPTAYRKLGTALGVPERAERAAAEAQRILDKYRGAAPVRVYLSCSRDGLVPCVQGHAFGEAAELLGAVNTAGTTDTAPRGRPLTVQEVRLSKPDVVIVASQLSADITKQDPAWQEVGAVASGRIYSPPDLPFSWGPRPPSVNRLFGVIWLAYVLRAQPFDDAFYADVRSAFETFYHFTPSREQLERLVSAARRPGG